MAADAGRSAERVRLEDVVNAAQQGVARAIAARGQSDRPPACLCRYRRGAPVCGSVQPGVRLVLPVKSATRSVLVQAGEVVTPVLAPRLHTLAAAGALASETLTIVTAQSKTGRITRDVSVRMLREVTPSADARTEEF